MFKKTLMAALAALTFVTANAQESGMKAFHSFGYGVEAGLMGFGLQFSMPVVDDHLVLVAGYNFYGIQPSMNFNVDHNTANEGLEKLNNKMLGSSDPSDYLPFEYLSKDIDINAKAKLNQNVKLLAEYYPSKKSGFHITAGLMFGVTDFLTITGTADKTTNEIYRTALQDQRVYNHKEHGDDVANYEDFLFDNLRYSIDDQTFALDANGNDDLKAEASVVVNRVKPYLGIGFGRSIPKKRVGFQFELGAWYHGKPSITSPNEVTYDPAAEGIDGIGKILSKVTFYPQMTFRLTGRIL